MAKTCPVDHRGLGYGPQGVCGRPVPFGGFKTVQNADEMFAIARALWDVTLFLDAADGLPEIKEAKDFLMRGGEYANMFHAVGHKDSHEWLPGREAGQWMASAKEVYAAAAMEGSFDRMKAWFGDWYPEADRIEQEVQNDPNPATWPEPVSLQQDPIFRQAVHQGDQAKHRIRASREVDRRLTELVQARVTADGLRQELVIYTVATIAARYLGPQRRARA